MTRETLERELTVLEQQSALIQADFYRVDGAMKVLRQLLATLPTEPAPAVEAQETVHA